jgi:Domain of unknown function (DUF4105)
MRHVPGSIGATAHTGSAGNVTNHRRIPIRRVRRRARLARAVGQLSTENCPTPERGPVQSRLACLDRSDLQSTSIDWDVRQFAGARGWQTQYIGAADDLAAHPRFYNTLTTNCTTTIFDMTRAVTSSIPFDWRIILTGYLPGYLYERGAVDSSIPLEELSRRADANGRIDAVLNEIDFSSSIRDGVPRPR